MEQQTFGNYSSCCRLCLSQNSSILKSVFDGSSSSVLSQQINSNIGIEIRNSDKISTMVCQSCTDFLNKWEKYKQTCLENQRTLESWVESWSSNQIGDISFQIKDEVIYEENDDAIQIIDDESDCMIKEEPMDTEQSRLDTSFDDLPPPLTPHPPDEFHLRDEEEDEEDENTETPAKASSITNESINKTPSDSKVCSVCDKLFSSVSNKNKHERTIHGKEFLNDSFDKRNEEVSEDRSPVVNNINEVPEVSIIPEKVNNETEQQKIQFAANLKLQLQPHSSQAPASFSFNGFNQVEKNYIQKCKDMLKMSQTFICSCHNDQYVSFKQVLSHIRKSAQWFPPFTCYNCMITFNDRSPYMKHYTTCPKGKMENLIRITETKENTEMKFRIYQLYVCALCNFVFTYHEDFCQHVNKAHIGDPEMDTVCSKCGTTFETIDALRRHVYLSTCIMNYRCDICWKVMGSVTEFKAHCEQEHDNSEQSMSDYRDTFRKRPSLPSLPIQPAKRSEGVKKLRDLPRLTPEVIEHKEEPIKVINPHSITVHKKNEKCACTVCGKVYSSYHNMMRHAKIHDQQYNKFNCGFCGETFRLAAQLKQHEIENHAGDECLESPPKRKSAPDSRQYRYSCQECNIQFYELKELNKHKEIHKCICDECGKNFSSQKELDQHRSVHLNIKVYRDSKTRNYKSSMVSSMLMCEVCDKIFTSKEELSQHKLLHEEMPVLTAQHPTEKDNKKYACKMCNKTYLGYGGLWDHNNKHHPGRKIPRDYPRQCNYCDKMLFNGGSWFMHKQMHERISYMSEEITKDNVEMIGELVGQVKLPTKKNKTNNEDDSESYHTCKKCFKVFSSKYNLKNHMKCHGINVSTSNSRNQGKSGKQSKTYWCDVCHQACQGLAELQKHKQEHVKEGVVPPKLRNEVEHDEPKKLHIFLCDLCDKDFTTKFALKKHKERHDLECTPLQKKRYFYCKHCKIPFKNMTILDDHMMAEHNESVNPKTRVDVKMTYASDKYACNVCQKMFEKLPALYAHQGWHSRDKFKKHIKTQKKLYRKIVNTIPKPSNNKKNQPPSLPPNPPVINNLVTFQCHTCFLQFATETALQVHILEAHRKISTSKQPSLHCNTCNINFDTQAGYNKHQQLHKVVQQQHPVLKTYSCKHCPAQFSRNDVLNIHIKDKHGDVNAKLFSCTLCDRKFEKQNALSTHLKVHERQKQTVGTEKSIDKLPKKFYSCSICHVGFEIAKDLRNHIISTHPF